MAEQKESIYVSPEWIQTVKGYLSAHPNASNQMFPKDSNFSNQLAEVSTPLYIQNKYISDPNLQKVKVHLTNEGTLDYQTELEATRYTISLLNPIRRDVGVQEYQITEQSLNDSTKIAEQYVRDNWTIFNKHAHDLLALLI